MPNLLQIRPESKTILSDSAALAAAVKVPPAELERFAADASRYYGYIEIPKASGGLRIIRPPVKRLRVIQRRLLRLLYARFRLAPHMHGGVPRKSIFTHARSHVDRVMVATLDVKNFFPSTKHQHIEPVVAAAGITEQAAECFLDLTLLDGSLPQGSPTSCLLANLAFLKVDAGFIRLCKRRGFAYSRYVDDIAISGDAPFQELRGPFERLIYDGGYEAAPGKVLFQPASQQQVVTGLIVNDRLRPTGGFIRELKHTIRTSIKHGPEIIALVEGINVRKLRLRLQGRVQHVAQCDAKIGRRLSGMMCGVRWVA
jgi:RNA-directed DNA polymerase